LISGGSAPKSIRLSSGRICSLHPIAAALATLVAAQGSALIAKAAANR
jgi:hypothetical protein